ncbi:hypothetical protein SAMN04489712_107115 [Thermomonospora echinospora]|uniref:Uncharacterized protein n=1 Tax=Thermomonospora echinospora TaxID=1992 RepID=A0A1H6BHL0_9ACTN|nr:hypothetical protein [Thermomonospora echinospora]SEG60190.1 hypothetical protein SAMN04489712_107115 [Thermomonospora echinospora]
MRLLVLVAAVLLVALAVMLVVSAFTRERGGGEALEATARWEAHTVSADGVTTVVVRKVAQTPQGPVEFGRQSIASIPDGDPEWESRYHEAMAQARSRVAALQIEAQ